MAQSYPLHAPSLVQAALPVASGTRATLLRNLALAVAGSLLMVLAAKVKVPFWPVPMTLQTLAVLSIGAAYGSRLGAATVLLYIGYGVFGLPVFTNTPPVAPGLAYLMGPTGGFLLGFVLMAAIAGWAARRGASWLRLAGGLALAEIVMMTAGFLWLALGAQMASGATGLGLDKAFLYGVQPFLIGDALKVALAACFTGVGWSLVAKRG